MYHKIASINARYWLIFWVFGCAYIRDVLLNETWFYCIVWHVISSFSKKKGEKVGYMYYSLLILEIWKWSYKKSLLPAIFTCSSVLSAWVFNGIFYCNWSFSCFGHKKGHKKVHWSNKTKTKGEKSSNQRNMDPTFFPLFTEIWTFFVTFSAFIFALERWKKAI